MTPRYDVLVVGGGLVGCALAWMLAGEELAVCLAERDQIGQHASGQNAGSLHLQLEYRLVEQGQAQAAAAARVLPLHLYSADLWRSIDIELAGSVGLTQHGGLMVAETSEQVRFLERKAAIERAHGLPVEIVDEAALRELAPYLSSRVIAAAHCPLEGRVNARTAATALAAAAARRGADILTRTEITAIKRVNSHWRASMRSSPQPGIAELEADTIVVAAGAWTSEFFQELGTALPSSPVALMMTVSVRRPPFIPHLVQHVGKRLSLKQTEEGNVLIGGGWPARLMCYADGSANLAARPELLAEAVAGNLRTAMQVAPALAEIPVLRSWGGITAETPDHLPIAGYVPGYPGLLSATGGQIFTLGPGVARALADLICGRAPQVDLSPYAPGRFADAA